MMTLCAPIPTPTLMHSAGTSNCATSGKRKSPSGSIYAWLPPSALVSVPIHMCTCFPLLGWSSYIPFSKDLLQLRASLLGIPGPAQFGGGGKLEIQTRPRCGSGPHPSSPHISLGRCHCRSLPAVSLSRFPGWEPLLSTGRAMILRRA